MANMTNEAFHRTVSCHKIVLCSLSQRLLRLCGEAEGAGEDVCYINLPGLQHKLVRSTVDEVYDSVGKDEVEIRKNEVTEVLGIDCKPLKRRMIVPSLKLKIENKEADCSDVEEFPRNDHEDIVKAEVEQSLKDDLEDSMDMSYELGNTPESRSENDDCEVKEQEDVTEEEHESVSPENFHSSSRSLDDVNIIQFNDYTGTREEYWRESFVKVTFAVSN